VIVGSNLVGIEVPRFDGDGAVHVVDLAFVEQLQMVDCHLQDLGLLELGRPRLFQGLRDEPLQLVQGAVDPIPAALLDGPASPFPVRAPEGLAPARHGAPVGVLLRAVIAVTDAVAPLQARSAAIHPDFISSVSTLSSCNNLLSKCSDLFVFFDGGGQKNMERLTSKK